MDEGLGTTLVTFLLNTPPEVRSVKLLGSWDNFTREYGMEKDCRIGQGHWRGCHTFTNIICDGKTHSTSRKGRNGALKMGGTYWYYYRLDDNVEFYNEAQPSTTSCPFLPGQPVNILCVPIYLPSVERRPSRDGSTGCAPPTHRTMDPKDKYTNPRPPPRPNLPLLVTSPGMFFYRRPWASSPGASCKRPVHRRGSSHPVEIHTRERFKIGSKSTFDSARAGGSPSSRSRFMNFSYSLSSGNGSVSTVLRRGHGPGKLNSSSLGSRREVDNYIKFEDSPTRRELCSNCSSPQRSPVDTSSQENMWDPSITDAVKKTACISGRKRGDSTPMPRGPPIPPEPIDMNYLAALRNDSIDSSSVYSREPDAKADFTTHKLVAKNNATPSPVDLNSKRLVALPNTPSSVFNESTPFNYDGPDPKVHQNHFSDWTIQPLRPSPYLPEIQERSRFSQLSAESVAISPSSMTSASTFGTDRPHSRGADGSRSLTYLAPSYQNDMDLSSHDGSLGPLSSYHEQNLPVTGPCIERQPKPDVITPPRISRRRRYYQEDISPLSSPSPPSKFRTPSYGTYSFLYTEDEHRMYQKSGHDHSLSTPRMACTENEQGSTGHVQNMMQELIDEMSYLANMIRDTGAETY